MNRGYMLHLFQKLKIVIISDVNNLIAEKKKEDTGEGGGGVNVRMDKHPIERGGSNDNTLVVSCLSNLQYLTVPENIHNDPKGSLIGNSGGVGGGMGRQS